MIPLCSVLYSLEKIPSRFLLTLPSSLLKVLKTLTANVYSTILITCKNLQGLSNSYGSLCYSWRRRKLFIIEIERKHSKVRFLIKSMHRYERRWLFESQTSPITRTHVLRSRSYTSTCQHILFIHYESLATLRHSAFSAWTAFAYCHLLATQLLRYTQLFEHSTDSISKDELHRF